MALIILVLEACPLNINVNSALFGIAVVPEDDVEMVTYVSSKEVTLLFHF